VDDFRRNILAIDYIDRVTRARHGEACERRLGDNELGAEGPAVVKRPLLAFGADIAGTMNRLMHKRGAEAKYG
jgi:hypothetical protein